MLLSLIIQGQLSVSLAQNNPERDRQTQTQDSCPEDIETLTSLMLEDLADYANRVIQELKMLIVVKDSIVTLSSLANQNLNL